MAKKLVIGSDHAGFKLKEKIKVFFNKKGIRFEDVGAFKIDKNDDYPDFAVKVSKKVKRNKSKGILFCGSGTGMAIAANKIKGIRAAAGISKDEVILARSHNDINILALNGINYKGIGRKLKKKRKLLDIKTKPANFNKTLKMIHAFLTTKFEGGRHKRRINKINKLER